MHNKNDVPRLMAEARMAYIERNNPAYDGEKEEIWQLRYRRTTDLW